MLIANVYPMSKTCLIRVIFVEKQFFLSVFTHTNHDHLLNGNYTELMLQMQGIQNFEESLLLANHPLLQHVYEN